jgi:oxaloacetate decarboxylase gamma subunit
MLSNLIDAAVLMAVGMIVVFTFLGLLIGGIYVIRFIGGDADDVTSTPSKNSSLSFADKPSKGEVAAIASAVQHYRNRNQ